MHNDIIEIWIAYSQYILCHAVEKLKIELFENFRIRKH